MKEKIRKGKRNRRRWFCIALAMLLATLPVTVFSAEKPEWYYKDSILVCVEVDESRAFSPEDFSVIDCKKVFVLSKEQDKEKEKIRYLLVLMSNSTQKTSLKEDIEKLLALPMVISAEKNDRFMAEYPSNIKFFPSYYYLSAGENVKLNIGRDWTNWEWIYGIKFRPDSKSFDMNNLKTDSFSAYGITRFWPDIEQEGEEQILRPDSRPEELEAQKSENGWYYGLAGNENEHLFDTIARLSASPEILSVSVASMHVRGRSSYIGYNNPFTLSLKAEESDSEKTREQYWSIQNKNIIDYTLHSFEDMNGQADSALNVRTLKRGIAKVTVEERYFDSYAMASCILIVHEPGSINNPGDMDHDGVVSTDDALYILKYKVGLIDLGPAPDVSKLAADLNQDEIVDEKDALLMLKIAAGIF